MPFNVTAFVVSVVVLALLFCIWLCYEIVTRHTWLPVRLAALFVAIASGSAIIAILMGV